MQPSPQTLASLAPGDWLCPCCTPPVSFETKQRLKGHKKYQKTKRAKAAVARLLDPAAAATTSGYCTPYTMLAGCSDRAFISQPATTSGYCRPYTTLQTAYPLWKDFQDEIQMALDRAADRGAYIAEDWERLATYEAWRLANGERLSSYQFMGVS